MSVWFTLWLAVVPLALQAGDKGNLIPNGNFEEIEEGADPQALPKRVQASSDVKDREVVFFSLNSEQKASGDRSLQVHRTENKGNARVLIATVPVEPGGRYYLSCQVKSTEGRPGLLLELRDKDRTGANAPLLDAVNLTPGSTLAHGGRLISLPRATAERPDEFNKLEAVFTIPPDVHYLTIRTNYSWIVGTAWYDDFELYSLD